MSTNIYGGFQICISVPFSFFLRVSLVFLPVVSIFSLLQRALYYLIGKIFFHRTEAVAWKCSVKRRLKYLAKFIKQSPVAERFLSAKL